MYKNNELNKSNAPRFNTKIQSCQILELISITNMLIGNSSGCSSMIKPKVPTSSGMMWFQRFWRKAAGILGWIN